MGTVSQACLNMKAFVIVALVAAVSGEADPYTIGQVLAGQTNGGVLTSTTYHGGVKVAGFPYTKVAAVPHTYTYGYPYAYYGKRGAEAEPEPWTVGQIAAGAHIAEAIKDGRAHNVGFIPNAAIAPIAAPHAWPDTLPTPMPTLATPTPTTARGRLRPSPRPTPPWCTPLALLATPTLSEPMPSPTLELPTPLPTLPLVSPTLPTLASAPMLTELLCRAAGRGRPIPTPPSSTLPVPSLTPTESSPTPASTAPTPSTPSPTLPPDSLTPPTSASAPTTSVPSSLANFLT